MVYFPDISVSSLDTFAVSDYVRSLLEQVLLHVARGEQRVRVPKCLEMKNRFLGEHAHPYPEVFFQIAGSCTFDMPGQVLHLKPGEILIMPRGVTHEEAARPSREKGFYNIVFMYTPTSFYFHLAGERDLQPMGVKAASFQEPDALRLIRYLDDMVELSQTRSPGWDDAVRGLFQAHFSQLMGRIAKGTPERQAASKEHPKVRRCKGLVLGALTSRDLSVSKLAQWVQCAPDYLSHLFRTETGQHLTEYVNRQRVQYAKSLLEDPRLNISEVALACGYSDSGYFARIFRKITGQSPSRYRASLLR